MNALSRCLFSFWDSSIGKKLVVAVTGLVLVLFLAGHLTGNLLIFMGREAFNDYAYFLHHFLHGWGVWIARIGLLVAVVLHVWATISLTRENRTARQPYAFNATVQATKSSRIMIWTGLTILAFILFHLAQFTLHWVNPHTGTGPAYPTYVNEVGEVVKDPWKMVIVGFSTWYVVLFYFIAMSMLCSHLSHGVASMFQTLGLRSRKTKGFINAISKGYAFVIWAGFLSIPIAILVFGFGRDQ